MLPARFSPGRFAIARSIRTGSVLLSTASRNNEPIARNRRHKRERYSCDEAGRRPALRCEIAEGAADRAPPPTATLSARRGGPRKVARPHRQRPFRPVRFHEAVENHPEEI